MVIIIETIKPVYTLRIEETTLTNHRTQHLQSMDINIEHSNKHILLLELMISLTVKNQGKSIYFSYCDIVVYVALLIYI